MRRLLPALLLGLALLVAAPATGDPGDRKQRVDEKLSDLRGKISDAREQEEALESEIESVTLEIRDLEAEIGSVEAQLGPLEQNLALHQDRLDKLNELFRLQTERLQFLRRTYRLALRRLELRIVRIYQLGRADTLEVILGASSFGEIVDGVEFADRIKEQDARIAGEVQHARNEARVTRARTKKTRTRVAAITKAIEIRTNEVRALRDSLVSQESELSAAREHKERSEAELEEDLEHMLEEAESLQKESANLAARLQEAQGSSPTPAEPSTSPASSSGLIWPVSGSVTSAFGYRCLGGICRMHEGVDIGAGYGAPIWAAAAGTVVYAGWQGGYGNLILVDHGGGLATAYAHQSSFAVGSGASVSQGQVIGYVGCTGRCFGPHLHFEVRVNGGAVDPLGYL